MTSVYEPGQPIKYAVRYTKAEREWLEAKAKEAEKIEQFKGKRRG